MKGVNDMLPCKRGINGIFRLEHHRAERNNRGKHEQRQQDTKQIGNNFYPYFALLFYFFDRKIILTVFGIEQIHNERQNSGNEQKNTDNASQIVVHARNRFFIHQNGKRLHFSADRKRHAVVGDHHGKHGKKRGKQRFFHIGQRNFQRTPPCGDPQNRRRFMGQSVLIAHNGRNH